MEFKMIASEDLLSQFRIQLQNELEKRDFKKGPKLLSMDAGTILDFLKDDLVVSVQISAGENDAAMLRMEAEQEIAELNDVWDASLISFGREILALLRSCAIDRGKVNKGLQP